MLRALECAGFTMLTLWKSNSPTMETPVPEVTETELAILQLLWDNGPAPIRQLTQLLYPSGNASHYATVQKLLDRLESKGYVERDRSSMTHIFRAIFSRDD